MLEHRTRRRRRRRRNTKERIIGRNIQEDIPT
jgi:hypothetical protein